MAATSDIPGVVVAAAQGGMLRAHSSTDGRIVWEFNTAVEFQTKKGIAARGGSFGQPRPTVANGMLFIGSGYICGGNSTAGNVMLAFGLD